MMGEQRRWYRLHIAKSYQGIAPWWRANAYAVHGQDKGRRYLAAFPVPGETPDFHQSHYFRSMDDLAQHPFPHNKL